MVELSRLLLGGLEILALSLVWRFRYTDTLYKDIFEVFIKATKKLQGQKYPTLYYSLPLLSQVYQNLELIKEQIIVSYNH